MTCTYVEEYYDRRREAFCSAVLTVISNDGVGVRTAVLVDMTDSSMNIPDHLYSALQTTVLQLH